MLDRREPATPIPSQLCHVKDAMRGIARAVLVRRDGPKCHERPSAAISTATASADCLVIASSLVSFTVTWCFTRASRSGDRLVSMRRANVVPLYLASRKPQTQHR